MTAKAAILILDADDSGRARWWHPRHGAGSGALADMPPPGRWPLWVWIDTDQVLVSAVKLPGRQWNRLRQALPFALEDRLVQDVDRYHVALGGSLGGGEYLCASVQRREMEKWQALLAEHDLPADGLLPLCLALPEPAKDEDAEVLVQDQWVYLRTRRLACRVGRSELAMLLAREPALKRVHVAGAEDLELPTPLEVARRSQPDWPVEAVAEVANLPLNLLQGEFAASSDTREKAGRLWRRAAIVLAVAGVLGLVNRFLELREAQQDLLSLRQQAADLVDRAVPEAAPDAAPRQTLDQALAALKGTPGLDGSGFMVLLQLVGPAIAARSGLELEALEFRSDGMLLSLNSTSLNEVEDLRQQIDQATSVAVRLESQQTEADGGTRVRLRIGGGL
ncbi:MAG: type II secretion system protein GspL [Pseudomonadota bacterium]